MTLVLPDSYAEAEEPDKSSLPLYGEHRAWRATAREEPLLEWRDRSRKDSATIEKIRADYTRKYPNTWIAVHRGEIFGPSEDAKDLVTLLKERSIEPSQASFGYLDPEYERGFIF